MLTNDGSPFNHDKMRTLSDHEYEQIFLDKWSHGKKKHNASPNGLCGLSILQVHGYIQQEKVIICINPSCGHNFIHVDLAKILKVPTKDISNTQVDGKHVQVFKYFKITMGNYVLHSDFQA